MDSLTRDPMSSASDISLQDADGWLVCLRAGEFFDADIYAEWDEAIDAYDYGRCGWYAIGMYACRLGLPYRHLTYSDIESLRRSL